MVETGVKAHRATQRSSSPGKTPPPHPLPRPVFHSRARLCHREEAFFFPRKQVTLSRDFGGLRRCSPPPSLLLTPPMWRITIPAMLLALFSESAAACNTFVYLSVRVQSREKWLPERERRPFRV